MKEDNNFELRKENFQLKQKNQKLEKKVEQAKLILKDLLSTNADWTHRLEAEQFLNSENIILEDAQAGNSPFDADEVFNKEMKAYPEEKVK